MDKLSLLKSVFIFEGLENDLIKQLSGFINKIKYSADQPVFSEGDVSDAFYIIESGEVTIYKKLGTGKEKDLAVLAAGNIFGEMAFFSDLPRTANAKAKTDVVLLKITRTDFGNFIETQSKGGVQILSKLLQVVMERLEQTSRELATIYQTGKVISGATDLSQITKEIGEQLLLSIPEANDCAIFLYNEFNQEYDPVVCSKKVSEIPQNNSLINKISQACSGILINVLEDNDEFAKAEFLSGAKSFIIVPVLKDAKLRGFLSVINTKKTDAFKSSQCLLMLSVASQLAEAIENIRHRQEERDRKMLESTKQRY